VLSTDVQHSSFIVFAVSLLQDRRCYGTEHCQLPATRQSTNQSSYRSIIYLSHYLLMKMN